ncbi:hypothetical protein C2857_007703 [Epichloe festucae Fl1]|uniref:AMP-binding enzyme C-terminal domain-containing protein n=1 Tax=Epichloe festucae (strain Fl1) TaxID=877507 RepID=A0A7S9KR30_EPIFF|nr:hypothetical protein C2857_007703 [Epichloe festucae Fl1]
MARGIQERGDEVLVALPMCRLIKVRGPSGCPGRIGGPHSGGTPLKTTCVVIGIPAEREGEVPKAFVVQVSQLTDHKTLRGGVEFINVAPKNPGGKILRRVIRDQERAKMKKQGAKF